VLYLALMTFILVLFTSVIASEIAVENEAVNTVKTKQSCLTLSMAHLICGDKGPKCMRKVAQKINASCHSFARRSFKKLTKIVKKAKKINKSAKKNKAHSNIRKIIRKIQAGNLISSITKGIGKCSAFPRKLVKSLKNLKRKARTSAKFAKKLLKHAKKLGKRKSAKKGTAHKKKTKKSC